jgi:hypothetical protein
MLMYKKRTDMMHGMKQIIEETELRLGQIAPVSGNEVFKRVRNCSEK